MTNTEEDCIGWITFGPDIWVKQETIVEVQVDFLDSVATHNQPWRVRAYSNRREYICTFETEPEAREFARLCRGQSGPQQYPPGTDLDHEVLGLLSKLHIDVLKAISLEETATHTCTALQISRHTYDSVRKLLLRRINVMDNEGLQVFARKNHLV
jgi:hypothetical protein